MFLEQLSNYQLIKLGRWLRLQFSEIFSILLFHFSFLSPNVLFTYFKADHQTTPSHFLPHYFLPSFITLLKSTIQRIIRVTC